MAHVCQLPHDLDFWTKVTEAHGGGPRWRCELSTCRVCGQSHLMRVERA